MEWVWKRLAPYVRARTSLEIVGITEEALASALHDGAVERLKWVETVVFCNEMEDEEKIAVLKEWFLEDSQEVKHDHGQA